MNQSFRDKVALFNYYFHVIVDRAYDYLNGIETTKQYELNELDISSKNVKHGKKYQACRYRIIKRAFKALNCDFSDRTLLDVGCGKGRALFVALHMGFSKVIGVDFSKELCEAAKGNLEKYCDRSEIILSDISDFEIPADVSVFFMFNPCDQIMMRKIVKKMRDQVKHHNDVMIVYVNPIAANVLKQFGFKLVASIFSPNPNNIIHVYRVTK
jgi:SAM-dependent methyltransferase